MDVLIFNAIMACYATNPMQYLCFHSPKVRFVTFDSQSALRIVERDRMDKIAVIMGFETFVKVLVTKDTNNGTPLYPGYTVT